MSIGLQIKLARIERGYTQKQLAQLCGWSQQQQYGYEKGLHVPTGDRLKEIAEILGKEWKLQ